MYLDPFSKIGGEMQGLIGESDKSTILCTTRKSKHPMKFPPALSFIFILLCSTSCLFDIEPSYDYPPNDRSVLQGPRLGTLPEQLFTLQQTATLPFQGGLTQFGNRYLLEGYQTTPGIPFRQAVIGRGQATELPSRRFTSTFLDPQGNVWGLSIRENAMDTLYQFRNGSWERYSLLTLERYYAYLRDIRNEQFAFDTNEGVVLWNVPQKARKAVLSKQKARFFTNTYQIGYEDRTVLIQNRTTQQVLHRLPTGYDMWEVFEDTQQRLWFVVRDKNWDGLLYQYDGKSSRLLTTLPVGSFDSGRNIWHSSVDKNGNFWISVDDYYSVYMASGKWVKPIFSTPYDKVRLTRVFIDDQQKLVATDSKSLFTITP